ncbi:tRNA (guanine(37)-N1)-methyltransferase-like [Rhagoletis pomonella]|uniref:tRNA (guanine(37)-N1)-methyltransferase-like n=1 Tax=Rhagoletis pomonella TaxID=28610 RepID=UPI00177FCE64|nr:tRNA (guanine(37)-N1)-methyltransferase-like [Rhagoletis pomonella]
MVLLRRLTLVQDFLQQLRRQRHYWKNMGCSLLEPPASVRGMLELNRDSFKKRVELPRLRVPGPDSNKVLPLLKKLLLKMEKLRPVRAVPCAGAGGESSSMREILLHPSAVKSWDCLPTAELMKFKVEPNNFYYDELELGYDNWRADEIFKSVLPTDEEGVTSYSRIGHIVHLNLRDHLLPYKKLVGEVLLDKVPGCRTVVNKAATIDNTYRNFQLELICGEPEYQVETKENGVVFEFDFSRVYWNPRLSTEHERITKMLNANDVLYDVFAGVGPFSVPAARKKCWVLANDLNPESYKWLQHNAKRNKCLTHMKTFNKDGRQFLLEDIKVDLLERWKNSTADKLMTNQIHITMNLPAMAVEFLDVFRGFLNVDEQKNFPANELSYPTVHVYSFAKGEDTKTLVRNLVEKNLGLPLKDNLEGIYFVRNVAPNKDMYRVAFRLTKEILITPFVKNPNEPAAETPTTKKRSASEAHEEEPLVANKVKCNS